MYDVAFRLAMRLRIPGDCRSSREDWASIVALKAVHDARSYMLSGGGHPDNPGTRNQLRALVCGAVHFRWKDLERQCVRCAERRHSSLQDEGAPEPRSAPIDDATGARRESERAQQLQLVRAILAIAARVLREYGARGEDEALAAMAFEHTLNGVPRSELARSLQARHPGRAPTIGTLERRISRAARKHAPAIIALLVARNGVMSVIRERHRSRVATRATVRQLFDEARAAKPDPSSSHAPDLARLLRTLESQGVPAKVVDALRTFARVDLDRCRDSAADAKKVRISPEQLDAFVSIVESDAWIRAQAARALATAGGQAHLLNELLLQLRAYLDGEGDPAPPGASGAGHD